MDNVKSFRDGKSRKMANDARKTFYEIYPEEASKIASKHKEGYWKLASKLLKLNEGESFTFVLSDGEDYGFGAKLIRDFDADMLIISAFGGGMEFIQWLADDETTKISADELYEKIKEHFREYKFIGFN